MRTYIHILILVLSLGVIGIANAQITNLIINSSDTTFTMESGGQISWSYNVPNGATTAIEIWLDVNNNGVIDTSVDKLHISFNRNGWANGNDGPGDMDGTVNGHVSFQFLLGFPPGNWLMQFSQGGTTLTRHGTITHLSSVAHTISGIVTPPAGQSAQYVFVQINRGEQYQPNFWEAITDSTGYYSIEMNSDTAGNPWRLRMADNYNPFPPHVASPSSYYITISGNLTGYNFTFVSSAAQVTGILRDENGNIMPNYYMSLNNLNGYNSNVQTDQNGYFTFGLASNEISVGTYYLGSSFNENDPNPNFIAANKNILSIQEGDSLFYEVIAYSVNSTIRGVVHVNGGAPNMQFKVSGVVQDSGYTSTKSDSLTGAFTLPVSNKLENYRLDVNGLPNNYHMTSVYAHPGDSDIVINVTVTGVSERESGIPSNFSLHQNYPNPFNPTTTIDYDLASATNVTLKVFNVLGEEVMSLVNQEQAAGKYRATIDASSLPSGIYFCQLHAGTFLSMKKMILTK